MSFSQKFREDPAYRKNICAYTETVRQIARASAEIAGGVSATGCGLYAFFSYPPVRLEMILPALEQTTLVAMGAFFCTYVCTGLGAMAGGSAGAVIKVRHPQRKMSGLVVGFVFLGATTGAIAGSYVGYNGSQHVARWLLPERTAQAPKAQTAPFPLPR